MNHLDLRTSSLRQQNVRVAGRDGRPSRVSHVLGLASAKLGFPSSAERDVLTLVKRGPSNRDIAQARQRSERTVANQVGAGSQAAEH